MHLLNERPRRFAGGRAFRRGIRDGWIPAIRCGGEWRVLAHPLRKKLGLETEAA